MIDTRIMGELFEYLEARHGMPWYKAILSFIDQDEMSSISDYDNYAQYVFEKKPEMMCVRYWHNKSLPREDLEDHERLGAKYGRRFSAISFHSYKRAETSSPAKGS